MTQSLYAMMAEAKAHHARGALVEAEQLYRRALAAEPRQSEALHGLALIAHQNGIQDAAIELATRAIGAASDRAAYFNTLGAALAALQRWPEAAAAYQRGLALAPTSAELRNNYGNALQAQGRFEAAVAVHESALKRDRKNPDILSNLAYGLARVGRLAEAIALYRKAIALKPRDPELHNNLGNALIAEGKVEAAIASFRRAIGFRHDYAAAHNNLGMALVAQGDGEGALASLNAALSHASEVPELHKNIGRVLHRLGRRREAITAYGAALALDDQDADAYRALGLAHYEQGDFSAAVGAYERAIALAPTVAEIHNNVGLALEAQGKLAEARTAYERALDLAPNYAEAHNNLSNVFKELGDFGAARAGYQRALDADPAYGMAAFNLAELTVFEPGDARISALEARGRKQLTPEQRAYVHFALAKALDDAGDYDRAFAHLAEGNALKRRMVQYDAAYMADYFGRVPAVFSADTMKDLEILHDEPGPVFIVGMPRSGSTLIEQILASHPEAAAAGEVTAFDRALRKVLALPIDPVPLDYGHHLASLRGECLKELAREYRALMPPLTQGKRCTVDKLPGNFLNIGLIRRAMPTARIIHATREPMDICFSCYSKLFRRGQEFSYDMAELAQYYRGYAAVMDHWRSGLPRPAMLELAYEDVVADLETTARRLLTYCGLPWNSAVLAFHRTERPIATASAAQVRQPLYRSSLGRWRKYESHLRPLIAALT